MSNRAPETTSKFENAIIDWFASLSSDDAVLERERVGHEHVIRMKPTNRNASPLEFRVGNMTFDLYFGVGFSFEDIALNEALALSVCDAVRRGNFEEEVWYFCNKIARTRGSLILGNGVEFSDPGTTSFAGLVGLGHKRKYVYEPWVAE